MIYRDYRTTSSDSLFALAGLDPVALVIAREAAFTNVISFGVSTHYFGRSWETPLRSYTPQSSSSCTIDGTFQKWVDEPSFSYLKSTLIEPHSTQEPTNSSQDMGRS
ncbi:hypothetical protein AVEN_93942-1 [Araneus ventricosus]|uniref:Uncharacterized protein n=1 Tax=Araneus ventricosus TaxID=182803 RepID=A0A4Y2VHJ6_ARAVE|nr:hypothetical protein AVEN_93942-1 [Araneus ventricosus]